VQGLTRGASSTAKLNFQQWNVSPSLGLADIFKMEWLLSSNWMCDPDFVQGARAHLINRDQDPHRCYKSIAEVPEVEIDVLCTSSWQQNPLDELFPREGVE
jgi:hypothetical protein